MSAKVIWHRTVKMGVCQPAKPRVRRSGCCFDCVFQHVKKKKKRWCIQAGTGAALVKFYCTEGNIRLTSHKRRNARIGKVGRAAVSCYQSLLIFVNAAASPLKKTKAVGYVSIQSKPIFTSATLTNSFGGWSGSRNHKAQLSVRRAPAFTAVIGEMLDITFLRVTVVLTYPQVNAPGRVPQIHLYGSRGNAVHHSAVTRSQSIYLKAVAETRRR